MIELKAYHCNEWHNEYTEFYLKSEADEVIRHQKYKRCLIIVANIKAAMDNGFCVSGEYLDWLNKWYERWLKIAEQFKED